MSPMRSRCRIAAEMISTRTIASVGLPGEALPRTKPYPPSPFHILSFFSVQVVIVIPGHSFEESRAHVEDIPTDMVSFSLIYIVNLVVDLYILYYFQEHDCFLFAMMVIPLQDEPVEYPNEVERSNYMFLANSLVV